MGSFGSMTSGLTFSHPSKRCAAFVCELLVLVVKLIAANEPIIGAVVHREKLGDKSRAPKKANPNQMFVGSLASRTSPDLLVNIA